VNGSLTVTADGMWGRDCLAYSIQAAIPDGLADALASIQFELDKAGLPAFHACPRNTLHISIFAVVPVRSPVAGKEDYWTGVSSRVMDDLDRLCRGHRVMPVHFDELRLTPNAIIAATRAVPDRIAAIRSHFAGWPAHPGWPRPVYDIMHVTLARFATEQRVPDSAVREVCRPISLAGEVSRIQLVRETVYPSLKIDALASFDLQDD
jgi:hypothetical protein